VENEAFYTTAAQVLPTILIALAIEANLVFSRLQHRLADALKQRWQVDSADYVPRGPAFRPSGLGPRELSPEENERFRNEDRQQAQRQVDELRRQISNGGGYALLFGILFLLGELAALSVVFLGSSTTLGAGGVKLTTIAGPTAAIALVALSVLAVIVPLSRLPVGMMGRA
jgi:hypothetical protein